MYGMFGALNIKQTFVNHPVVVMSAAVATVGGGANGDAVGVWYGEYVTQAVDGVCCGLHMFHW